MITSNVPPKMEIHITNGNTKFYIGNDVRVLLKNKNEYAGTILAINDSKLILSFKVFDDKEISFADIDKIRLLAKRENFDNAIYFDDEEREFWKTHIIGRDGIIEREVM